MNDITVRTISSRAFGSVPLIDIKSEDFIYSSPYPTMAGMQINPNLEESEAAIKQICSDITDKVYELYKLINK